MIEICQDNRERMIKSANQAVEDAVRAMERTTQGIVLTFDRGIFDEMMALFYEGAAKLYRGEYDNGRVLLESAIRASQQVQIAFVEKYIIDHPGKLGINETTALVQGLKQATRCMEQNKLGEVARVCRQVLEKYHELKQTTQQRYNEKETAIRDTLYNLETVMGKIKSMKPKSELCKMVLQDLRKAEKDFFQTDPRDVATLAMVIAQAVGLLGTEGVVAENLK